MKKESDKRKKKPKFVRQESNKKKALGSKWRRPKGLQSKLRLSKAGHRKKVSIGYGSSNKTKNLDPSGLKRKWVYNLDDILNVQKDEGIIISSSVGNKKRLEILKKAKEQKIKILNIRDIDGKIKQITESVEKKKKEAEEKDKERKKAKEEAEKKKEEKKEEPKEEDNKEKKELTKKFIEETEHKKPQAQQAINMDKSPKQMKVTAPKQK